MRNAGLDEAQAGIKIARRNINNLRYADNTILMAESKEELKNLLMKVKSESEAAQSFPTLHDPMDCSPQAPPSMGFPRQEYWSGVSLPSPCSDFGAPQNKVNHCFHCFPIYLP